MPKKSKSGALLALVLILAFSCPAFADNSATYTTIDTPRFILYIGGNREEVEIEAIDQKRVADTAIEILDDIDAELTRIFGVRPEKKVVLRFLTPQSFREETGAPEWTSAMYLRDEISIPLTAQTLENVSELKRALRHEYVHALIAQISNYRCPAWLDEGVAQIIEGQANPLLGPALRDWIKENPAMPLEWLRNGFTTLENAFVPAAYAQSLFAVRRLIHQAGFPAVVSYLQALNEGKSEFESFRIAFKKSQLQFERSLTKQIALWANSAQIDP